jgi:hypothetical protein
MSAAELQQINASWKNIMKKKLLGVVHLEPVLNVRLS